MGSDLCHFHSMMMSGMIPAAVRRRDLGLLADEDVVGCDLDKGMGAGGSVYDTLV